MLGQAHRPRRRLLPLAAIALAVLAAPAVGGANPHSVSSLRSQDAAIAAKSRAAVLGLYSLDQRLAAANERLAALRRRAGSLRAERATLRAELHVARHGTALAQQRLAERVRILYEEGNVEPIEIVFGAKNLEEGMTNLDNLTSAASQGEDVLRELRLARQRLAKASRQLATRESALAASLREAEATAASLASARAERTAYIASLASQRAMTKRQIATAIAQAHAAQVRTATLQHVQETPASVAPVQLPATAQAAPAAAAASVPAPAPAAGGRTITVSATGYSLGGTTATGLPVGWGVVAVDPSVIPLGTHMTIPGYGEAVAADTGGAVVGNTIDLWFPSVAQANAWGRRTVTISLH